jgi:hypothetical protein
MGEEKNKKVTLYLVITIIVVIIALFLASIWSVREGCKYRTGYIFSEYEIIIYTESSLGNIELLIPIAASNASINGVVTQNIVETTNGQMIKINLADMEYKKISWRYKTKLTPGDFSSQENQTVWLYSDLTNATAPMHFTIMKIDWYDTLSFLESQIDYAGVLSNPYPDSFGTYQANSEYTEQHKVELLDGWNQYPIVTGTYSQYAD